MTPQFWVIGVDGGGTKTLGILADASGTERSRRAAGASNPNVVGIDTAAQNLEEVILGCCALAHTPPESLSAVVLGLAGAGSAQNRQGLRARLLAKFGSEFPLSIETDARIALEGALGGKPGIVIIAGTGSIVSAKTAAGDALSVGGWGRALGDEGSGFFIGMEAVKAMARSIDHMLDPSALPGALKERCGWESRDSLLQAVYSDKVEPSTLAPVVLELAGGGDQVCVEILQRAARALADQAVALLPQVGTDVVPVATCGGLIERPTSYRDILAAELCGRDRRFAPQMPERPAVDGAVLMALSLASGDSR